MTRSLHHLLVSLATSMVAVAMLVPVASSAIDWSLQIVPKDCATVGQQPDGTGTPSAATNNVLEKCGLDAMFQTIINVTDIILALTGSAALLMFTYAGLTFIIAAGSQDKIGKAKEILEAAVIGIAVILLGWTMVHLTIITITGGEIGSSAKIFGSVSPTANPNK